MNKKIAALLFLATCLLLAGLLMTNLISPLVSGFIFAVSLLVFGGFSGGFRKNNNSRGEKN